MTPSPERQVTLSTFEVHAPALNLAALPMLWSLTPEPTFPVAIDSTPPPRDAGTLLALACLLTI